MVGKDGSSVKVGELFADACLGRFINETPDY